MSSSGTGTKSARTRQRILDAAAYVLSRNGFAGTRLGDIADRAECQAPAIYYYFESREQLIEEVVWIGVARLRTHVSDAVESLVEASPAEKLNAALEAHLRFVLLESDYTMASIRNAGQMPLDLRDRQLAEQQKYALFWRQLFREAKAAKQLRPGTDERLARMLILGSLNWTTEWWKPQGETVETLVRNARLMLNGGFLQVD
jgi:AcrR family transcriptional regulator